jgi:hypothetical protein
MCILFQRHQALETADADMPMRQPHQHGGASRAGLVTAMEMLAGFDHGEGFRGVGAQRFQHGGGQNLAHRAFQRESPVALSAPWRDARSLGAKVHQPPGAIAHLGKEEAAPITQIGIVMAELVAVIAQRQRLGQIALKRLEPPEMGDPRLVAQPGKADGGGMGVIAPAQDMLGKLAGAPCPPASRRWC